MFRRPLRHPRLAEDGAVGAETCSRHSAKRTNIQLCMCIELENYRYTCYTKIHAMESFAMT